MGDQPLKTMRRRWVAVASAMGMTTALSATVLLAPPALADDSVSAVKAAVAASRAASSCAPFGSDPVVQKVAEVANKSVNDWLDHTAVNVPIEDPLPGLKELGYKGTKGNLFGGASQKSPAEAIKASLLEGWARIPDCSYTDMGASFMKNEGSGEYLVMVVVAGP